MKCFAFAVAALALGFAASTPARADYTVIQFDSGYCEVWSNSNSTPWGYGWRKLAIELPDWDTAQSALYAARANGECRS
jgi:hypothetical protein